MAKEKLTRKELLEGFRHLSEDTTNKGCGFYKRLLETLDKADDKSTDKFWEKLEANEFTDMKQVVSFFES